MQGDALHGDPNSESLAGDSRNQAIREYGVATFPALLRHGPGRAIDCMGERNGSFQLWKAAETFAILLPLASRSTILHMAAICGASLVRKFFPV
jgi:hypothetical protein